MLSGAQTYCEGPTEVGTSVIWRHFQATGNNIISGGSSSTHNTSSVSPAPYLGLDNKRPVASDGDLLLHDAEAVEATDEHAGAVQPEGEVDVVAGEAVLVVLNVLTAVHVEEEEVVQVAFREGLLLFVAW